MAKKQAIVEETPRPLKKAAAPRVKAARHRTAPVETPHAAAESPRENTQALTALIAYGYWEARGRQGGDPLEDWLRAEKEVRQAV